MQKRVRYKELSKELQEIISKELKTLAEDNAVKDASKKLLEESLELLKESVDDVFSDVKYDKIRKNYPDFDVYLNRVSIPEDIFKDPEAVITLAIEIVLEEIDVEDEGGLRDKEAAEIRSIIVNTLKNYSLPNGKTNVFEYITKIKA